MKKVTISVRKVTAYAVVRTIETECLGGVETILEAADATRAIEVASALAALVPGTTLDLDEEAWASARGTNPSNEALPAIALSTEERDAVLKQVGSVAATLTTRGEHTPDQAAEAIASAVLVAAEIINRRASV